MKTRESTVTALKLTLRNHKHSDSSSTLDIFIYRERPVCQVFLPSDYINILGQFPEPLFCWPDASPISRSFFVSALKADLQFCDLDISHHKTHSFRIGAASWAVAKGMSDTQIRDFGRWKSNAFFCDIFEPPQWGLCHPSKRNLVPFAHACSGILVWT